jgi:hypothetical protein
MAMAHFSPHDGFGIHAFMIPARRSYVNHFCKLFVTLPAIHVKLCPYFARNGLLYKASAAKNKTTGGGCVIRRPVTLE